MTRQSAGPRTQLCPCSARHSPPITDAELDVHHSPPKSWPLAKDEVGNVVGVRKVVTVCATTHRRAHRLLNAYVHAGSIPARAVLAQFRAIELELAAWAWANADHSGPAHLPYTLTGGDAP